MVAVSKEGESLFCAAPRDSFAESRIREAIERGDFANVPGSGRPLDLGEENPFAGDMEVAYRILRQAGGAPLWIELGREIDDGLEALTEFVVAARSEAMQGSHEVSPATGSVARQGSLPWWKRVLSRLFGSSRSRSVVRGSSRRSHKARTRARNAYLHQAEEIDLQVERFNACRPRALTWLERPRLTAALAAARFDREWPPDGALQPTSECG
ncbi:MAG TPA: hypothetical protein DCL45_07710 [Chloroflexi bacterium]|nr:hypothetical protein [Chloroflexota bacterium]